jgi:probable O-glycosylation ligase (exosortase A-associated)
MRDILVIAVLLGALPFILKRPWFGALMWVWVSVMNPHRLTWGVAFDMPFAMLIAITTLVAIVINRGHKQLPLGPTVVVLVLLFAWMHVTLLFAMDHKESLIQWNKVVKIFFMFFVVMYVLHTKEHIQWLVLVITASIAFFGVKGGLFTLRGAGGERVYGPAGSFIEENNALAVAVIMTIPLLRYWHQQAKEFNLVVPLRLWRHWVTERRAKLALLGGMLLCALAALGSQSRGALLAISAMLGFLWLKSRSKFITLFLFILVIPPLIGFMPQSWEDRMRTITTYESDGSAMGRIDVWTGIVRLANDRPLVGGGFGIYEASVVGQYMSGKVRAGHSIWFQFLGEHGYVGLFLFMLMWMLTWRDASWTIRRCDKREGWQWAADLARMIQVSLVGYFVGGAFLQLAYFDMPYYLLIAVVLTRKLVEKEVGTAGESGKKGWYAARNPSATAPPATGLPAQAVRPPVRRLAAPDGEGRR